MRLPEHFAREWVNGLLQGGWRVRVGNKCAFISRQGARTPGFIRHRLEAVLGIESKPSRTQEDIIVGKSRKAAIMKRAFRNRIAAGTAGIPPWAMQRTLRSIIAEERTLDITNKWQRMGEVRR